MEQSVEKKSLHTLGLSDLYALGIGQVIGAGVVTVLGAAMAITGKSVWLAYAAAVLLGFVVNWSSFVKASMARLNGGNYSAVSALLHPVFAGIYMVSFIPNAFSLSLFGIALGQYTKSLIPAVDARVIGVIITTFFYIINLIKIKDMARVQKAMTALLIGTLLMFVVFGLFKTNRVPFEFSSPDFYLGGAKGFLAAVILLEYSTTSYSFAMNYSRYAIKPKKNIPNAMWLCVLTIAVLYVLIAIVATGVLPVSEVAGKPLTFVARAILPGPLFYLFIVGGVLMALATTLLSMFGSYANIILAGVRDGWFPEGLGKLNRFGRPWKLITIIYAISVVPIIVGLDVATVTNNILLLGYSVSLIVAISSYVLPFKYPEICAKCKYFINRPFYFITITLSTIAVIAISILSATALSPLLVTISLSAIGICVIYAILRYRTGKVKIENVFIVAGEED